MSKEKKRQAANPMIPDVRGAFREKQRIVKRTQRNNNSHDMVDKFDLSEKYLNRRVKAVQHMLSPIMKRYAKKYPDVDIIKEFIEAASCSLSLTYDTIEGFSDLCKGAAIWMLDRIEENGTILQLCRLLSKEDNDIVIPDVYDTRFSSDLITRMICMLLKRYGEADRAVIPSSYFSKHLDTDSFHEILALIPDQAKKSAADHFKQKYWEWGDLYYIGLHPIVQEYKKVQKKQEQFGCEMHKSKIKTSLKDEGACTPPLLTLREALNEISSDQMRQELVRQLNQWQEIMEISENAVAQLNHYRYIGLQTALYDTQTVISCMSSEIADAMMAFKIEDPYEICFALLYLLDQDDDYIWSYSFATSVVCQATVMLPWYGMENDEGDIGTLSIKSIDPSWYERTYTGGVDQYGEKRKKNLAQLVYQYTGVIMPRNTQQFDNAAKKLRKNGLKMSQIRMLCAVMNVLVEASHQIDYDGEGEWMQEELSQNSSGLEPLTIETMMEENVHLKTELARQREQTKKEHYELMRENRNLKDRIEQMEKVSASEMQELADLREIVFYQQSGKPMKSEKTTTIAFPYSTDRRVVVFGGRDTWLREIKFKVPDARFMGENISNPEVIRRADVIWIQTNCIGHSTYYSIINLAKRTNRMVRYFKYASAAKCAEQIAEEEEKSKER